jgi:hypothetical protein
MPRSGEFSRLKNLPISRSSSLLAGRPAVLTSTADVLSWVRDEPPNGGDQSLEVARADEVIE